ncbi:PD-(D/E)XK nuclease family protein [Candidatus Woesearchaeota archaeon]|nr:PD-(D/E)XK nuclease family protein [Candidatus Woesearchaeota archaeon]
MKTYKLSPHALNLYQECRRCFWEGQNGLKRPSGPFPSLPSGMDKIIKQRFDTHRKKNELPEELSGLEDVALYTGQELKEWQNQRKGLQWTSEQGNILAGALDDVLQTAFGELIVLDYKTRGFPLKELPTYYTLQLECYTLLLQKKGFKTRENAYLLFYWPEKFSESGEVNFTHKLLEVAVNSEHAENAFTGAVSLLQGEKPDANKDCSFCSYRDGKKA